MTSQATTSRLLLRRFMAALAVAAPTVIACGGDVGGNGGDAGPDTYRNCGGQQDVKQSYTLCLDASAEASTDASADSGDGGDAAPPNRCFATCTQACQQLTMGILGSCAEVPGDAGTMVATCHFFHPCGRRPAGLESASANDGSILAKHLALSAWMEAASVTAFERMARELEAHGAPARLIASARRAAADEVRHTNTMTRLSKRHGVSPPKPRVRKRALRSLYAIARENAVEGCVRETYGAILAMWQANHAGDSSLRRAMKVIAEDERRHAALAMTVAAWIEPKLTNAQRARLLAARERAIEGLARELAKKAEASLVREAGIPTASIALQLHATLRDTVWSHAA